MNELDNTLETINIWKKWVRILIFLGLAGVVVSLSIDNILVSGGIIVFPLLLVAVLVFLQYPVSLLYLIFTLNYFLMGIFRYINIEGISVIMDVLLMSEFLIIIIHSYWKRDIDWKPAKNALVIFSLIWMLYCILEILNPTGVLKGWVLSRGLIFNGFILSLIVSLIITKQNQVKTIVFLYASFTLLAILKALMQKYIGFDAGEQRWLAGGGAVTHIIQTGTRYFSFFTDAGNFGSNMGCSGIIFGILAFIMKNNLLKIFYALASLLSLYAMFMSGTRGAMVVPLVGLAFYIIICKNYKAFAVGALLLSLIYCFFAFTYIGQENAMIRRMRSAFRPTEDASFNVRRENQKKLAEYLKYRPFGEGLGLSGVENRDISLRFTTSIPNDSWYVKIWVETGIVGLIIYLGGLIIVMIKCARVVMFKIKNKELAGILGGLLCGIFGMLVSAYGNPFWGQFPTMIIAYIFLGIILKGPYLEKLQDVEYSKC
ncbi:O-antigen ligase family protein [Coprobacter tertius]|uniref:O-antigen ligase family protein n=1 Tax=Coprobacter tertius TaxID=2944915 RepID=A0ABT1ME80_9BACT|nr:O-antigen ligase family protein [Coprobacter tertius]MCP9610935.1 O-antigen ligase family protein [Coprobacter tertius]